MTQHVWDQNGSEMTNSSSPSRLETPTLRGHRHGVKACSLIGRKLGSIYEVPSNSSEAIEALLRELDRKTAR
jgi:hypothetical protein